jgi:hypothetical protein
MKCGFLRDQHESLHYGDCLLLRVGIYCQEKERV